MEDMHKDARTIFKSPMVQMVGKVMRDGKLESLSLNDGKNIEHWMSKWQLNSTGSKCTIC